MKPRDQDARAFNGVVSRFSMSGPRRLYRLCGSYLQGADDFGPARKERNSQYGVWWFDAEFFWNTLDAVTGVGENPTEVNRTLRRLIREATAVSFDWNSFDSIWEMNIPTGRSVDLFWGIAKEQPFFSTPGLADEQAGGVLPGGIVQFLIYDVKQKYADLVSKSPRPFFIGNRGYA